MKSGIRLMYGHCPHCDESFLTNRPGEQECPHCGKPVDVPAPTGEEREAETAEIAESPAGGDGELPPWERSGRGMLVRLLVTWRQALFTPSRLFGDMRVDRLGGSLLYGLLVLFVAYLASGLYFMASLPAVQEFMATLQSQHPDLAAQLAQIDWHQRALQEIFFAPAKALESLLLPTFIFHGSLVILGINHRGWRATMRAVIYGCSPMLLAVIPLFGSLVGVVWALALQGYALMQVQRITRRQAMLVVGSYLLFILAQSTALVGGL